MTLQILEGDCRETLHTLPDNSVDSCVTDPPYALVSVVKRFGSPNAAPAKGNDAYMRASNGFMGKTWDTGETAMSTEFWVQVYRVLKPGAFVAAFGATRGYHRMACAIEDAGFEIRDSLMWVYGTGFPKSHSVGKSLDPRTDEQIADGVPQPENSIIWEGWGTALKPAFEPIVLARKLLSESTVAANVLRWRTGALNIDACRIPGVDVEGPRYRHGGGVKGAGTSYEMPDSKGEIPPGRWPANVVTDGSDEVIAAFPQSNGQLADARCDGSPKSGNVYGKFKHHAPVDVVKMAAIVAEFPDLEITATLYNGRNGEVSAERRYADQGGTNFAMKPGARRGDSGSAARFFYSAKASKADRAGSKHPTVKPIALMAWLARLITPPGGTILDPFAGSGTTGAAAIAGGFRAILCEREAEYIADIKRRFAPAFPWVAPPKMPWESP